MVPTADDLRAEIARRQVNRYVLAGLVRIHPGRLGAMLNGRLPMPPNVAERVGAVLRRDFRPPTAA
jgi:hypothetical protein